MAILLLTSCACGAAIYYADPRCRPRMCDSCKAANERDNRARRNAAKIPLSVRAAIISRDGYVCAHCGCAVRERGGRRDIQPDTLELDHILPVAGGGQSTVANLVVSCMACNRKKGASEADSETPYWESLVAAREGFASGAEPRFGERI